MNWCVLCVLLHARRVRCRPLYISVDPSWSERCTSALHRLSVANARSHSVCRGHSSLRSADDARANRSLANLRSKKTQKQDEHSAGARIAMLLEPHGYQVIEPQEELVALVARGPAGGGAGDAPGGGTAAPAIVLTIVRRSRRRWSGRRRKKSGRTSDASILNFFLRKTDSC
jgi:hypothetical protein